MTADCLATDAVGSRVLIVDDDPDIRGMLTNYLTTHDFVVSAASTRKEMDQQLSRGSDIVLLDLRLGIDDGLEALRTLRASDDVPVIVMSGHRRDEVDRIVGLELGADDYLTKPVGLRELLARIRAVLRRVESATETAPTRVAKSRFAGWILDRRLHTLTDPDKRPVKLTKGEYALLVAFLDSPGQPLSREALLNATRVHEDVFDRSIDVQILRLRRKIEQDPACPKMIVTERGFGYVFSASIEVT